MPGYLQGHGLEEDVTQRTFELLLWKPRGAFERDRGSARSYIMAVANTARRDVIASYAPPGQRTRARRGDDGEFHTVHARSLDEVVGVDDTGVAIELGETIADPGNPIDDLLGHLEVHRILALVGAAAPAAIVGTLDNVVSGQQFGDATQPPRQVPTGSRRAGTSTRSRPHWRRPASAPQPRYTPRTEGGG